LLNLRWWRTIKIASLALLVIGSAVVANTIRYRHDKNHFLKTIATQSTELQHTKVQLGATEQLLANAEKKLGFLNQHKTTVQVTAFTGQGKFANGHETVNAYAVPHHLLPEGEILNIALSPAAQQNLHARLNDYIVLLDAKQQKARLARFVDTTSDKEIRPVVDVFFALEDEARIFGRQQFEAINISAKDSPFREK
jgi:hypothetical protein